MCFAQGVLECRNQEVSRESCDVGGLLLREVSMLIVVFFFVLTMDHQVD